MHMGGRKQGRKQGREGGSQGGGEGGRERGEGGREEGREGGREEDSVVGRDRIRTLFKTSTLPRLFLTCLVSTKYVKMRMDVP